MELLSFFIYSQQFSIVLINASVLRIVLRKLNCLRHLFCKCCADMLLFVSIDVEGVRCDFSGHYACLMIAYQVDNFTITPRKKKHISMLKLISQESWIS